MSAVSQSQRWISPEEYMQGELLTDIRHEYFAGEIVAMAGASLNHNRIAGNIYAEMHAHLRGKCCEAFINDMKEELVPTAGGHYFCKNEGVFIRYRFVPLNSQPSTLNSQ